MGAVFWHYRASWQGECYTFEEVSVGIEVKVSGGITLKNGFDASPKAGGQCILVRREEKTWVQLASNGTLTGRDSEVDIVTPA